MQEIDDPIDDLSQPITAADIILKNPQLLDHSASISLINDIEQAINQDIPLNMRPSPPHRPAQPKINKKPLFPLNFNFKNSTLPQQTPESIKQNMDTLLLNSNINSSHYEIKGTTLHARSEPLKRTEIQSNNNNTPTLYPHYLKNAHSSLSYTHPPQIQPPPHTHALVSSTDPTTSHRSKNLLTGGNSKLEKPLTKKKQMTHQTTKITTPLFKQHQTTPKILNTSNTHFYAEQPTTQPTQTSTFSTTTLYATKPN
ncbi:hypothetical protein ACTFIZ_009949 [Dictyostelium cf. discoideum]